VPARRSLRPEVGLDAVARETRFSAQAQDRKQTQRPLLLRGYRDGRVSSRRASVPRRSRINIFRLREPCEFYLMFC